MKKAKLLGIVVALGIMVSGLVGCGGEVKELKDKNVEDLYKSVAVGGKDNYYEGVVKATGDEENPQIEITLRFKTNAVFTNGNMKAIQNIVEQNIAGKYNEESIYLKITSDKPVDFVRYVYRHEKWEKLD